MMNTKQASLNWYVVLTKPRQEERAAMHLEEQGGETFLPFASVEKIKSGQLTTCREVMFPGYLFLRCNSTSPLLSKVRSTPGARMLLRFGVTPVVVYPSLIDDIRSHSEADHSEDLFKPEQKLRIQSGPFKDYVALFKEYDGEKRAIVLLNLLNQQQELAVELTQLSA